jgi:hypothetical protein
MYLIDDLVLQNPVKVAETSFMLLQSVSLFLNTLVSLPHSTVAFAETLYILTFLSDDISLQNFS